MPAGAKKISAVEAQETILDKIDTFEDVGGSEADVDFLEHFFESNALEALLEMYDDLTEGELPLAEDEVATEVCHDVLDIVSAQASKNRKAAQLRDILKNPHMQALLSAHDDVAHENYGQEDLKSHDLAAPPPPAFDHVAENHRLVTITKQGKQPLGITVSLDKDNNLIVARILQGSLADRQGLLRVEDKVREVNGVEVYRPEDMMLLLKEASTSVTMRIIPSDKRRYIREEYEDQETTGDKKKGNKKRPEEERWFFVRALFNYDPLNDRLIPCKKAGLPFNAGDILQVVSTNDENWWQARSVSVDEGHGPVGLIPSRTLQEKRSAFVQPGVMENNKTSLFCGLKLKKKKHINYNSNNNTEFDECDIKVYEEVTLTNYHTRVLALVGAKKVGKRSLIAKLIRENPTRFQAAIPYTTRPMGERDVDGRGYFFTERETMEREIHEGKFLDYGEFDGELYGIKFSTVRAIIKTGRVCVMAVSPNALKMIKAPDFQPYIVFIAAPSVEAMKVMYEQYKLEQVASDKRASMRSSKPSVSDMFWEEQCIATVKESRLIEKVYRGYFDETIVNDDFNTTYKTLKEMMSKLHRDAKWVPVEWNQ